MIHNMGYDAGMDDEDLWSTLRLDIFFTSILFDNYKPKNVNSLPPSLAGGCCRLFTRVAYDVVRIAPCLEGITTWDCARQ